MQFFTYVVLAIALAGFAILKFVQSFRAKNDPSGPPGPTLFPYLGRVHDLPIQYMWLKFKEWADTYGKGGLYRTEMLGAKFVIISDEKIAEELLVKRAKHNSDRPMVRSLFDSKSTFGSMEYLPLMGKNRTSETSASPHFQMLIYVQNTGLASAASHMPTSPKQPTRTTMVS